MLESPGSAEKMAGLFSKFQDEDELEQWYADEKERLDAAFAREIEGKQGDTSHAKEKYSGGLKKLIAKYQDEYARLIPRIMKQK